MSETCLRGKAIQRVVLITFRVNFLQVLRNSRLGRLYALQSRDKGDANEVFFGLSVLLAVFDLGLEDMVALPLGQSPVIHLNLALVSRYVFLIQGSEVLPQNMLFLSSR